MLEPIVQVRLVVEVRVVGLVEPLDRSCAPIARRDREALAMEVGIQESPRVRPEDRNVVVVDDVPSWIEDAQRITASHGLSVPHLMSRRGK